MRTRNTPTCEGKLGRQVSEKGLKNHSASPSPVTVARHRPIRDGVVDVRRAHIVDVLRIVGPPLRLARTDELPRLHDDLSDAALPHAGVFAARGGHAVHHDARHRLHAVLPLAARLALDEPRQQLAVGVGHRLAACCFVHLSLCAGARPREIFLKMRELFSRFSSKPIVRGRKKPPAENDSAPRKLREALFFVLWDFFLDRRVFRHRVLRGHRRRAHHAGTAAHLDLLPLFAGDGGAAAAFEP